MEYARRKAADPAPLPSESVAPTSVPWWVPVQSHVSGDPSPVSVRVTEVLARDDTVPIEVGEGDEVIIVRVPERQLEGWLRGQQRLPNGGERLVTTSARRSRASSPAETDARPWWARLPLLRNLVYRSSVDSEQGPPGDNIMRRTSVVTEERHDPVPDWSDLRPVTAPLLPDPYVSLDSDGKPFYRRPELAAQAVFEAIPDVQKPVLNPTDDLVVPDDLLSPFRGGYGFHKRRPIFQYSNKVPFLPTPYYPTGHIQSRERQRLSRTEITDHSPLTAAAPIAWELPQLQPQPQRQQHRAGVEEVATADEVPPAPPAGEISILDTGEHFAIISGDIRQFVDFDGGQSPTTDGVGGHADDQAAEEASVQLKSLASLLRDVQSAGGGGASLRRRQRAASAVWRRRRVRPRQPMRPQPQWRRQDAAPPVRFAAPRRAAAGLASRGQPGLQPLWEGRRRVIGRDRQPGEVVQVPVRTPQLIQQPALYPTNNRPPQRAVFKQTNVRPVDQPEFVQAPFEPSTSTIFNQPNAAQFTFAKTASVLPAFSPGTIPHRTDVRSESQKLSVEGSRPEQSSIETPLYRPTSATRPEHGQRVPSSAAPSVWPLEFGFQPVTRRPVSGVAGRGGSPKPSPAADRPRTQTDLAVAADRVPAVTVPGARRTTVQLAAPPTTVVTTVLTSSRTASALTPQPHSPIHSIRLLSSRPAAAPAPSAPRRRLVVLPAPPLVFSQAPVVSSIHPPIEGQPPTDTAAKGPVVPSEPAVDREVTPQPVDGIARPVDGSQQPQIGSWASAALAGLSAVLGVSQPRVEAITAPGSQPVVRVSPIGKTSAEAAAVAFSTKPVRSRTWPRGDATQVAGSVNSVNAEPGATAAPQQRVEPDIVIKVKRYRKRLRPTTASTTLPRKKETLLSPSARLNSKRRRTHILAKTRGTPAPALTQIPAGRPTEQRERQRKRRPSSAVVVEPTSTTSGGPTRAEAELTILLPRRRQPAGGASYGSRVRPVARLRSPDTGSRAGAASDSPEPTTTEGSGTVITDQARTSAATRRPARPEVSETSEAGRSDDAIAGQTDDGAVAVSEYPLPRTAPSPTAEHVRGSAGPTRAAAVSAVSAGPTRAAAVSAVSAERTRAAAVSAVSAEPTRAAAVSAVSAEPTRAAAGSAVSAVSSSRQPQSAGGQKGSARARPALPLLRRRRPQPRLPRPAQHVDTETTAEHVTEDAHTQLQRYLSKYAEKYGLGLIKTPPPPERRPADRAVSAAPAAPVTGLRWAHLAGRGRTTPPADDPYITADQHDFGGDGDERVSLGSQFSYRIELPPSRREPPALGGVRRPQTSRLAQLLNTSARRKPTTEKPEIPWPAGYSAFPVSETTPRPAGRWSGRRQQEQRTTSPPAAAWTSAWSRYADEFTTTGTPPTTARPAVRSRPRFVPPINRTRNRARPPAFLQTRRHLPAAKLGHVKERPFANTVPATTPPSAEPAPRAPVGDTVQVLRPPSANAPDTVARAAQSVHVGRRPDGEKGQNQGRTQVTGETEQRTSELGPQDTNLSEPGWSVPAGSDLGHSEPGVSGLELSEPGVSSLDLSESDGSGIELSELGVSDLDLSEPVGESSLFSLVYSKERPHQPPPQPGIFHRLNQFLAAHGQVPPEPVTVSVSQPDQVPPEPVTVSVSQPDQVPPGPDHSHQPATITGAGGASDTFTQSSPARTTPHASVPGAVTSDGVVPGAVTSDGVVPGAVTSDGEVSDGTVIVQAVAAGGPGSWVPSVKAVSVASVTPAAPFHSDTVLVYPQSQPLSLSGDLTLHGDLTLSNDLTLSDDLSFSDDLMPSDGDLAVPNNDLQDEVVYFGGGESAPSSQAGAVEGWNGLGQHQRLRWLPQAAVTVPRQQRDNNGGRLYPTDDVPRLIEDLSDGPANQAEDPALRPADAPDDRQLTPENSAAEPTEAAGAAEEAAEPAAAVLEYDPYGVFWASPTGATNAEQAESQRLVSEFAADPARQPHRRTVNMCLDGKCMLIYEPGRQVRLQN